MSKVRSLQVTIKILMNLFSTQKRKKEEKKMIFFKFWFGLTKKELMKTAIGSFVATLSGISKLVFGFFIITVGVAYYHPDAREKVRQYSLFSP